MPPGRQHAGPRISGRIALPLRRPVRGSAGCKPRNRSDELAPGPCAANGGPSLDPAVPPPDGMHLVPGRHLEAAAAAAAAAAGIGGPAILDRTDGGERRPPLLWPARPRPDPAKHGHVRPAGADGRAGPCRQLHPGRRGAAGIGLYRHPAEWPWEYIFIAIVQGQFAVYQAGRSLGIDAIRLRAARP